MEPAPIRRLARQAGVTEPAQSLIRRARREEDDEDRGEEAEECSTEQRPTPQPRKRRRTARKSKPKPLRSGRVRHDTQAETATASHAVQPSVVRAPDDVQTEREEKVVAQARRAAEAKAKAAARLAAALHESEQRNRARVGTQRPAAVPQHGWKGVHTSDIQPRSGDWV